MLRQRVRIDRTTLVIAGQLVTVVLCLAVTWYGVMLGLLALDAVDAATANALTGYRDAYEELASLVPEDVDGVVRLITGVGGLLAFILFGWLALKQLPRPRLTRAELVLAQDERGEVTLEPRAFERAVEGAASGNRRVTGARGRYAGSDVSVGIAVDSPTQVADTLHDVDRRVKRALREHGLPDVPVHVTLTKFDRERRLG